MRIILGFLCLILTGCAIEGVRSERELSTSDRQEIARAYQTWKAKEDAQHAERVSQLRPGMRMSEVNAIFGEPTNIEMLNGRMIHRHDSATNPMIMTYSKNGELESFSLDREEIERMNTRWEAARQRREASERAETDADNERRQRIGNALQSVGQGFQSVPTQRNTTCTSRNSFGTVQTNCTGN